ncbi:MAG: XdhC/CoxI family protein [Synergistales bacterium]|nr:XdhC/CoxI family protein [Synergistales bacterium]
MANQNRELFRSIAQSIGEGGRGVLCTIVDETGSVPRGRGAKMWVHPDGTSEGTIGGGIVEQHVRERGLELLQQGEAAELYSEEISADVASLESGSCGGSVTVFLESIGQEREVVVFGAGFIGQSVARTALMAGFRVTLWDDREDFANQENAPGAAVLACPLTEALERIHFTPATYAVVCTRGHGLDMEVLGALESKTTAYVGMLGSHNKNATIRKALLERGTSQAYLDSVHAPIGLSIGADTPEEIAVSIVAEIIATVRGAAV